MCIRINYMLLNLRKPDLVEYFTFREIPLLNIQATLACWCSTPTSHSITHFGNNSPSRLIQLGFAAKYIV